MVTLKIDHRMMDLFAHSPQAAILGVNVFFLIRSAKSGSGNYAGFDENDPNALPPDGRGPIDTKGQYSAPEY